MAKILNIFHNHPREGKFGIEIEVEGERLPIMGHGKWVDHDDGSLRGEYPHQRHEYVLAEPLSLEDAKDALWKLDFRMKEERAKLNFSFRTSVHVHLNVQNFDEVQLLNLVYLYTLLEEPLVNFCGEGRKANRFCLRLADAEGFVDNLSQLFYEGVRSLDNYREDAIRYASLNLAAVRKYGSVEFRAMRGTLDLEVLFAWLDIINALSIYATKRGQIPLRIREKFKQLSAREFVADVVGEELARRLDYPGLEQDMNMSHSLSIDLPHYFSRSPYVKAEKPVREKKPLGEVNEKLQREHEAIRAIRALHNANRVFLDNPVV